MTPMRVTGFAYIAALGASGEGRSPYARPERSAPCPVAVRQRNYVMVQVVVDFASVLEATESEVLGDGSDGMDEVERRLVAAYPNTAVIAWEGDAATFEFKYVSPAAVGMLGYAVDRWVGEPAFWAEQVVLEEDRNDAIAYCALATAGRRDHVFEYRARTADGRVRVLRDVVRVIVGRRGIPERLRGLMFDVSAERTSELSAEQLRARQAPTVAELKSGPARP